MIQEPLASVLRSGRDLFNARFAAARRERPDLDGARFAEFVTGTLDPLARAWPHSTEALAPVVIAGYDVGLQITGEAMTTDRAGGGLLGAAWRQLAPANWTAVASDPSRFFSSISNAIHHLTRTRARPEEWVQGMARVGAACPDLAAWLQVGQVLAWRSGLASFRAGALELLAKLPAALAVDSLGMKDPAQLAGALAQLQRDPWFDPATAAAAATVARPRIVARVGAFRGLGGQFSQPPTVAAADDQLFVRSGDDCWWLLADTFGHALHRATPAEFGVAQAKAPPVSNIQVTAEAITSPAGKLPNPAIGGMTSCAILPHVVAITSRHSHAIVLVQP